MNEPRQVPIGMFSRSVSRTSVAHLERVKLSLRQNCSALVRRLVRTPGTHCGARTSSKFAARFAPLVRTLLREAGANPCG